MNSLDELLSAVLAGKKIGPEEISQFPEELRREVDAYVHDYRMRVYERKEPSLDDMKIAVWWLRHGRETAKPKEKKKKAEAKPVGNIDDILGLGDAE